MKILLLLTCLLPSSLSTSLAHILGMGGLLDGLAVSAPSTDQFGNPSTAYMLDPNINVFLTLFRTRTQFCDYKCKTVFNLPCFLLFACNIQTRNFILMFMLPLFMLVLGGVCCGKRLWSLGCWVRYLRIFLGINFILWVIRKCQTAQEIRNRKLRQKKLHQQQQLRKNGHNMEIQPPISQQRVVEIGDT